MGRRRIEGIHLANRQCWSAGTRVISSPHFIHIYTARARAHTHMPTHKHIHICLHSLSLSHTHTHTNARTSTFNVKSQRTVQLWQDCISTRVEPTITATRRFYLCNVIYMYIAHSHARMHAGTNPPIHIFSTRFHYLFIVVPALIPFLHIIFVTSNLVYSLIQPYFSLCPVAVS